MKGASFPAVSSRQTRRSKAEARKKPETRRSNPAACSRPAAQAGPQPGLFSCALPFPSPRPSPLGRGRIAAYTGKCSPARGLSRPAESYSLSLGERARVRGNKAHDCMDAAKRFGLWVSAAETTAAAAQAAAGSGLRPSAFFRPSALGFRISRATSLTAATARGERWP